MPKVKPRRSTALREKLAEEIARVNVHVGEQFVRALGDDSYLLDAEEQVRRLVAGEAVEVTYADLSSALWDLGDPAAARDVERASAWVVDPDGSYRPA